ncbi:heme ABC exporter ATP-binding protein CcmA [Sneathiella glossodoripedis]|uniref:heme ABC exporter ATP-binding protein CcmA n=1 Tax=Sneathiella glossodoripedis TaxID=418853 RepID=UPI00047040F8|nr:heme ABC exporter ATP-binding protein CcmA [Sneathiella glossodoripedis]
MTLIVENLGCVRQERIIFSDVNFTVKAGQALWVKGRNGTGKSSLLRIIAQLLKPASGQISWQQKDVLDEPVEFLKRFEYIGHLDALKTSMTPRENLSFWAKYRGPNNIEAAIEAFKIEEIADFPVRSLSAGQKKRSNLARLIACPSKIWILDEPISSLDVHFIDLFTDLLRAHLEDGGLALYATHQDLEIDDVQLLNLDEYTGAGS